MSDNDKYRILVSEVLRKGWLKYSPEMTTSIDFLSFSGTVYGGITGDTEAMASPVVCFCDIPLTDLPIHMEKYSKFGLSFSKQFLIEKGANPVMYVAKDAASPTHLLPLELGDGPVRREDVFRNVIERFHAYSRHIRKEISPQDEMGNLKRHPTPQDWALLSAHKVFVTVLFNHIKFFDAASSDDDEANVYMEREWRVPFDVRFLIADVATVFLPRAYAERFRNDMPEYNGQLIFSDQI